MGSGERLEIQTEVTNSGEDAFNALLEVQLPRGVSYINANTTDSSVNILCSPPSIMNNNTVQCEIGNPLRANKQVTARIYVMPSSDGFIDTPVSEFYFLINSKSSNPEAGSEGDNWEEYSVPIRVETDFRVTGKSDPLEVEYNITAPLPKKYEFEDEIGEEVSHIYDVKNKGPTSISEAEVYILWPSYNEYEDHLLYLLGFEYDNKKAFCEPFKNLNPLMVKVSSWKKNIGIVEKRLFYRFKDQELMLMLSRCMNKRHSFHHHHPDHPDIPHLHLHHQVTLLHPLIPNQINLTRTTVKDTEAECPLSLMMKM